jgi:hypothetical protein
MPKPGYKVVTIGEDVLKQAQDHIDKVNKEAGYKKIRNVSHLVEEAIISFAVNQVRKEAESPEDLLARIVEVAWEREELVKKICQHFLDMPPEEGRRKLRKILGKKGIEETRKLLAGGED